MITKYKFVEIEGCTAFDFTINGISLIDISKEKQLEVLDYLYEQFKIQLEEGSVQFQDFVKIFQYSDYDFDEHNCEQCGDRVSWTTWEI